MFKFQKVTSGNLKIGKLSVTLATSNLRSNLQRNLTQNKVNSN